MTTDHISGDQLAQLDLPDWRSIAKALEARFLTRDFATGLEFVNAIGAAAEAANHHPDLDLRYAHLNIRLISHDVGHKTSRDIKLARTISELAAARGIAADPSSIQRVEFGLDTPELEQIKPFWRAVLGLKDEPHEHGELVDPDGQLPTVWFQPCEPHETPTQRWHPDIWVPVDVARQRVDDALAEGGTMVSTDQAPTFWVLADPQGNKVCVCTHTGRTD